MMRRATFTFKRYARVKPRVKLRLSDEYLRFDFETVPIPSGNIGVREPDKHND